MILNKKQFCTLKEDALDRFYKYIQIDEIKYDYYKENIDFDLLNPILDYVSVNYKEIVFLEVNVSNFAVVFDLFYKDSIVPCGYYKSFYNLDESKNQFECIDEIFNLFINDFQF